MSSSSNTRVDEEAPGTGAGNTPEAEERGGDVKTSNWRLTGSASLTFETLTGAEMNNQGTEEMCSTKCEHVFICTCVFIILERIAGIQTAT